MPNKRIETTVVIVNWNGAKYLRDLLLALKQERCHVLVVDNNSTDSSRMGKNRLCDWLQLNDNWGFANANNIGASVVNTDNILFLNNDMLPIEGFLPAMEAKISNEFPIVGGKLIFGEDKDIVVSDNFKFMTKKGIVQHAGIGIHEIGLPYEIGRNASPDDPEFNIGKEVSGITGACLLVRTKVFSELKGFNNSFVNGFEDVDFCWRAREKGYKSWYEPTAKIIHYCSSSKGRFDFERGNRELLQSLWTDERLQKIKVINLETK